MENMDRRRRQPEISVENTLFEYGDQFQFHAAVKALEALCKAQPNIGTSSLAAQQPFSMCAYPDLSMRGTDIYKISRDDGGRLHMSVNFFGIETRQGPLPEPYMADLYHRIHSKDHAFHDFLSLFNHRLLSILHRIRKKYWIGIDLNLPEKTAIGKTLTSFLGLDNKALVKQLTIPERSLMYYSGLVWGQSKPMPSLLALLQHFFKYPIKIKQLIGEWHHIEDVQTTKIGGSSSQFMQLGHDAALGTKFWSQQTFFQMRIGPLTLKQFIDFLKPGKAYQQICQLTKYYVGAHQSFRLQLVLHREEVPKTRLGKGAALGWTSWLKIQPFIQDADDVILTSNPQFRPKISQK